MAYRQGPEGILFFLSCLNNSVKWRSVHLFILEISWLDAYSKYIQAYKHLRVLSFTDCCKYRTSSLIYLPKTNEISRLVWYLILTTKDSHYCFHFADSTDEAPLTGSEHSFQIDLPILSDISLHTLWTNQFIHSLASLLLHFVWRPNPPTITISLNHSTPHNPHKRNHG